MRTITATQLRQQLGEILDAASAGEKILIERDHKPLAYLVSVEDVADLAESEAVERELAALDALIAIGDEWRRTHPREPGELTAEQTVRWDRDHRDAKRDKRSFEAREDVEMGPDDEEDGDS